MLTLTQIIVSRSRGDGEEGKKKIPRLQMRLSLSPFCQRMSDLLSTAGLEVVIPKVARALPAGELTVRGPRRDGRRG